MTEQLCMSTRFAQVTEATALAAADWVGRGDGLAADQAAREAMSAALSSIRFRGRVVAGRMTQDRFAPMQPGQLLGVETQVAGEDLQVTGEDLEGDTEPCSDLTSWDLAVAPLEGHEALSRGLEGALAMIAAAPTGGLMAVPEMYMQKIIVCREAAEAIDMRASVMANIRGVAEALNRSPEDLTVAVLNRPRHEDLIEEIKTSGARLKLIQDGDVSAGIAAVVPETTIDMLIGIGGSTEGIITAAAIRCLGGAMQARFWPVSRSQVDNLKTLGIEDVETLLTTEDMAGDGVMTAMTAVTTGRFLQGVTTGSFGTRTETMVMCSQCHKVSMIKTIHRKDDAQPTPPLWMS
ncbi:MAG: fructose-bisphosphatase class II family protein [Thermoleophilia bacterium]|jgi:fructose-1,6-bisphosphatase II